MNPDTTALILVGHQNDFFATDGILRGDRVLCVVGRVGFNATFNTSLGQVLHARGIESVLACGPVMSLCIDSTGRAAHERGYDVTIVSDCTSAERAPAPPCSTRWPAPPSGGWRSQG